jgi:hypothetical protein
MSRHACNDCDQKQLLENFEVLRASVQASRDTGCCVPFDDSSDTELTLTPFERIAYWGCVGLSAGCSLVVILGSVGYLLTKLL